MKKKYKFWSIYNGNPEDIEDRGWLCIPPAKKYVPEWYPKGALIKKHNETILPPPSYWLRPDYESIVYFS
jgi:hypothetical protein